MIHLPALLISVLFFAVWPAYAATYVVAPDGDDANAGASAQAPFRTLKRAITAVKPGDTIELRSGVYDGSLVVSRPGTKDAWITLKPYRNEKPVIDAGGGSHAIYFYRDDFAPLFWTMKGIEARGGDYVVKIDTPYVNLIGNNFHGSKGDIIKLVKTARHVLIKDNEIHHNSAARGANAQGIDIVGSQDVTIVGNHVHDIPSIAMYAKGGARRVVFEKNKVEDIYQRGIMLGQSTSKEFLDPTQPYETYDSVIRNNVIRNTGSACLATASSKSVKIHDNVCLDVATTAHGAIFISNESELGQAGTDIDIHSNVIVGAARRPMVFIGPNALTDQETLRINNNRYWARNGADDVMFSWERGVGETGSSIWGANFAKWKKLTGKDANSQLAAPAQDLHKTALK